MRLFWATHAIPHDPARIHPALTSFAGQCCGTLAGLLAYVGVLALLAIVGIHLWDELSAGDASEPSAKAGWSAAARSYPFAVSQFDLPEKTETYRNFRHPGGGRKDASRWTAQGEKPVAELEIYRPGSEFSQSAVTEIATRMAPAGGRDALPARRGAIGCILNRLILLSAGNEPKLAELFARAELKRSSCAPSATSAASMDRVSSAENLGLRGTL
ncbi:MAG: hypothetical protein QOI87_2527 [Bradyrhizobium sp.]|nr:hypothetical protein [Bradyrhizobium sp.]